MTAALEICSESGIVEMAPLVNSNNIARRSVWLPEGILEDDSLVRLKVTCTHVVQITNRVLVTCVAVTLNKNAN